MMIMVNDSLILVFDLLDNCFIIIIDDYFVVSLQRDLVPGVTAPGEKGTGCESRTDGAAVCPW